MLKNCNICPRNCGADRTAKKTGFCGEADNLKIACAMKHFGEEPPITAVGGSGTIFFTGCNLRCAFCQNYQISQHGVGREVEISEAAEICLKLQEAGAENINIVTGSHFIPQIAQMLAESKKRGLKIPVCWNSSAYENVSALELLDGLVDIWLPDLKTLNPMISDAVFRAKDYPTAAKAAIRWMIQHSKLEFAPLDKPHKIPGSGDAPPVTEKMLSGVIIRHLILPGRLGDTQLVLDWLKQHADNRACISLMSQYTPVSFAGDSAQEAEYRHDALNSFQNRLLTDDEFGKIRALIAEYEFSHLFYQELDSDTGWLPDFTKQKPFPAALAQPVWSYLDK